MIHERMLDLRTWSQSAPNGERTKLRRRFCVLDRLENRTLLSGSPTDYTVDLTSDTGATTGTDAGDLLYSITQANANSNTAGSEIQFDPTVSATPQTITPSSRLVLSETQGPEVIDGPGASVVTISGNNTVEVFYVVSGVAANFADLTIADGLETMTFGAGGIYNQGTLALTACTVSGNSEITSSGNEDAGGIFNQGTLSLSGCTVSDNSNLGNYALGGGIHNEGTLTVTNSTISGNSAFLSSGGVQNDKGNGGVGVVTVTNSTIAGNSAGEGAGINNVGTLTLTSTTVSDNHASGGDNFTGSTGGGGIYDSGGGTVEITGSTFADNSAERGGGILVGGGALTIANSTVADNSASVFGGGGFDVITNRIVPSLLSQLTAVNTTIAYNNVSGGGGGGLNVGADCTAILDSTIVALNTGSASNGASADDIAGAGSVSGSFNLIGTGGAGGLTSGTSGNLVGIADPGLDTLADYGGPTRTIALLPGSPAIGAGRIALAVDPEGNPLATDQRGTGYPRIVNGTVDIGAYEASPTDFTVDLTTDTGASTSASAGDLLYCITQANAESNPSGSVIEFDPTVFATPQTITLTNPLELYNPGAPEVIDGPGASFATISGNHAVVVFNVGGEAVAIAGLTIEDGSNPGLDGIGGGIVNGGTLTVNDCTISHNEAGDFGGGIGNNGTLTVSDCTFSQNSARDHGGGIGNINGEVTVTDSTISDNSGGGFWETGGKLTIIDSTVDDNSGPGISATSGGNHSGSVSVSGCTVAGNSSERGGGGIFVSDGELTIANSTIADNSASEDGGGIEVTERSRPLTVVNSTIAGNDVSIGGAGGGLFVDANCTATLNNTIVALNTDGTGAGAPADDIASLGSVSGSYNLIGTGGSGGLTNGTSGNQVGVANPGLGALAGNSGPTQTIALLAGSPAINAGNNSLAVDANGDPLTTDQRGTGYVRNFGGIVDIGAFEFQLNPVPGLTLISPTPTPTPSPTPTPTPTQMAVIGEQPLFHRKLNTRGKPIGKSVLTGFKLDFGLPLSGADAASAANYEVDFVTTKRVKRKTEKISHPVTNFTVSYVAASDEVVITLRTTETFPTGGKITVKSGVTTISGGTLTGNAVFIISKGGKNIRPL